MTDSTVLMMIVAGVPPLLAILAGVACSRGLVGIGLTFMGGSITLALAPLMILAVR